MNEKIAAILLAAMLSLNLCGTAFATAQVPASRM